MTHAWAQMNRTHDCSRVTGHLLDIWTVSFPVYKYPTIPITYFKHCGFNLYLPLL